jgi:hypothetical protein
MTPTDKLGNPIKKGQYVSVTVVEHNVICEVVDIREPSMLSVGPGKENIQMAGALVLISKHIVGIDPRNPQMMSVVVCQTPDALKTGSA